MICQIVTISNNLLQEFTENILLKKHVINYKVKVVKKK